MKDLPCTRIGAGTAGSLGSSSSSVGASRATPSPSIVLMSADPPVLGSAADRSSELSRATDENMSISDPIPSNWQTTRAVTTALRLALSAAGAAFPGERGGDDRVEIGVARLPAQPGARQRRVGDEFWRVARPPLALAPRPRPAAHPLHRGDHLAHRAAAARPAVGGRAAAARGAVTQR